MPKDVTDVCSEYAISVEDELESLRDGLLGVAGLSELFKVLSDETRTRILHLLSRREMCVCDIAAFLDISESAVSHQLRYLRTAGIVKNRREGTVLYYRLIDDHVKRLIDSGREHINDGSVSMESSEKKQTSSV